MKSTQLSRVIFGAALVGVLGWCQPARAELNFNWDSIWSSWLEGFQTPTTQTCPQITAGQGLALGKVVEVGVEQAGGEDIFFASAPFGMVNGVANDKLMKVQFKYEFPCTECDAAVAVDRNRAFHYAMVLETGFSKGKAVTVSLGADQGRVWQAQQVNGACVYSVRVSENGAYALPTSVSVE